VAEAPGTPEDPALRRDGPLQTVVEPDEDDLVVAVNGKEGSRAINHLTARRATRGR
jgi:hypothetical protein